MNACGPERDCSEKQESNPFNWEEATGSNNSGEI